MIGIEYLCNINNISYAELGRRLGISRQTVAAWLSGRRKISEKHYEKLKEIFNVPEEYFRKELSDLDKQKILTLKLDSIKTKTENIDRTTIELNMEINKSNGEEFTTQELAQFLNDYTKWIESKGLVSGGSCGFVREEN